MLGINMLVSQYNKTTFHCQWSHSYVSLPVSATHVPISCRSHTWSCSQLLSHCKESITTNLPVFTGFTIFCFCFALVCYLALPGCCINFLLLYSYTPLLRATCKNIWLLLLSLAFQLFCLECHKNIFYIFFICNNNLPWNSLLDHLQVNWTTSTWSNIPKT